jgi:glyoxylase-like metal-dependent hydrolase (beta-lactamase superfamily II)
MPIQPLPSSGCFRTIVAPNASPYTLDGTNTYLLGDRRVVVIDPGPDDARHLSLIDERARDGGGRVTLILVTHAHEDHIGGARRLAEASGAPIARWHAGDRPLVERDIVGEEGVRLRVVHTPGHAPDHVAFVWEDRRTLFSGDLVLGRGTVTVSPPAGSMDDYLQSLERVARLNLAMIAPGHGPLVEHPAPWLAEYIAHRQKRERQILDAVSLGPRTPGEVAASLYAELDPRVHPAAEATVLAHLLKLLREGRVAREGNRYYVP